MFCIPKILKNESNSQQNSWKQIWNIRCFVSQRYWKMKAIHNTLSTTKIEVSVVLYPKDTEKWKQFTTAMRSVNDGLKLFCIPKILKNESNSQLESLQEDLVGGCFVSQRYWKMKAIHNFPIRYIARKNVVLYPKDTEKWKQFTTMLNTILLHYQLFCIPKILKNESNSQLVNDTKKVEPGCFVSQRYWKMKAIHNRSDFDVYLHFVVLYPKDTEKWKQFTTCKLDFLHLLLLFCIPKILKNESNSQLWLKKLNLL